jgi:ferredoxin, 2Fe-2S
MPKITVLPHAELCPEGKVFEARSGVSVCDALLAHHVEIEHACDHACACSTCHVIIREGYASLTPPEEGEDDMLDKAWGLQPQSRLSCQAMVRNADLVVEIPKYSLNLEKEGAH